MTDLVKLYNPANAGSLTPEEIEGLQKLTTEQIKELSTAYPNVTMGPRPYLLIIDGSKPPEKQIANLSSFQNLYNLRAKNASKYVAYQFQANYKGRPINPAKAKRSEVVDLSDTELMTLPGFNPALNSIPKDITVPVTKVKKVAKAKSK